MDISGISRTQNDKKQVSTTYINESATKFIAEKNVGLQILSYLFMKDERGNMSMERIFSRGQYNATDQDYLTSATTKRGVEALKDLGTKLLDNNYLILVDHKALYQNWDLKSEQHGWTVAYLYKMHWSEELFYKVMDLWVDESTPEEERALRNKAFSELSIPMDFVTNVVSNEIAYGVEIKKDLSAEENFYNFLDVVWEDLFYYGNVGLKKSGLMQIFGDVTIKTSIYSSKPITAKIGNKEGMKTDDAYRVYENVQQSDGSIKKKKIAIIRATKKIAKNTSNAEGNSDITEFYRFCGRKVSAGMSLEEMTLNKNSIKLVYSSLLAQGGMFSIGKEFYGGKLGVFSTDLSIGYGILNKKMETGDVFATCMSYGVHGGYGFRLPNFHIIPMVGVSFIDINNTSDFVGENTFKRYGVMGDVNLAYNLCLFHPIWLNLTIGYSFPIGCDETLVEFADTHDTIFTTYGQLGLRFFF